MAVCDPYPRLSLALLMCAILHLTHSSPLNLFDAGGSDVECGKIARGSRMFHARIKGGMKVDITDFPHAVSLIKNNDHHCGGTLVYLSVFLIF